MNLPCCKTEAGRTASAVTQHPIQLWGLRSPFLEAVHKGQHDDLQNKLIPMLSPTPNSVRVNKTARHHRCGNKWCSAAQRSLAKYQSLLVRLLGPGKQPLLPHLCLVQRLLRPGLLRASLLKPRACFTGRSCKQIRLAKFNSNL